MTRVIPLAEDIEGQLRRRGELGEDEAAAVVVGQHLVQFRQLVEQLTPASAVLAAPVLLQARRNAEARAELDREFGLLDAREVAELVGSRSANRSSAAHSLRSSGRAFSVPSEGRQRYPGFQFDPATGKPRAAIAAVLDVLAPAGFDGWEIALWFTTPTGLLDGRRPVDLLDDAEAPVVAAAAELAAPAGI